MKPNPWKPLRLKDLPFRDQLLAELEAIGDSLRKGVKLNYLIYGPQGIGKTSVLLSLMERLNEHGEVNHVRAIYLNPEWELLTPSDFEALLLDLLSRFNIRLDPYGIRRMISEINRGRLDGALQLMDHLLKESDIYLLLLIDDLPALTRLSRYSDVRTTPQRFFDAIVESDNICMIASAVTFQSLKRALGKVFPFITLRELSPLDVGEVKALLEDFIGGSFEVTDEAAYEAWRITGGLPLYIHILGLELTRRSVKVITAEHIRGIVRESAISPWGLFNLQMRLLHLKFTPKVGSGISLRILREIVRGEYTISELAKRLGRHYQYIATYLRRLREAGLPIEIKDGIPKIKDEVYALWLRNASPCNITF